MSGTALAQLIPVLISPILAKIYSPEDFGLYSIYFSVSMVALVLMTLRYEFSILLPRKLKDAEFLVKTISRIATLMSFIVFLILGFGYFREDVNFLGLESMGIWIFILPLSLLAMSLFLIFESYFNRIGHYLMMSNARVMRSITYSASSVIFGFIGINRIGLILAEFMGYFIPVVFLIKKSKLNPFARTEFKLVRKKLLKYRKFPIFSVPSGIMEKFSGQALIYFLAIFFTDAIVGQYALAQRLMIAPTRLISNSMGEVFREQASAIYVRKGECYKIFRSTLKKLIIIGVPIFFLVYLVQPIIFLWFFSTEWQLASDFIQILIIMFFLQFVISPISRIISIAEKQQIDLYIQLGLFLVISFLFFLKSFFEELTPENIVALYSGIYGIKYLVEGYVSYQLAKGK